MKKLILLVLLVLPLYSFSQLRDSVYVKTDIFEVMYSEVKEQPLWVKYEVKCPNGTAVRKGMDFYTDPKIHTSDNGDYVLNIYDKGHLAPAADFKCDTQTLNKTFTYLNCSLQNKYLNRGQWRMLEDYERLLSYTEGNVKVRIDLYFEIKPAKVPGGASIPYAFKKTITTKNKVLCFYFLNVKPTKQTFLDYQIKCK